jgi:hypothetical protein
MIDFWELSGRLMLMDPRTRDRDIYNSSTGILPIQSDGCILLGHADTPLLPFPIEAFYDRLRDYFATRYTGADKLLCPVVSMFALGEIGVMFFNQPFRDLFEQLSTYLQTTSVIRGRSDTHYDSMFYIVVAVLAMDTKTRASIADDDDFLGLDPIATDRPVLRLLAQDPEFVTKADAFCFEGAWEPGSFDPLSDQNYGANPFRHFRFVNAPA